MRRARWWFVLAILVAGGVLGAGAVIASLDINRRTSTDNFCTACHSMQRLANNSFFLTSAHHTNPLGVIPTCGDCHIPARNWFEETYTHITQGLSDTYAELTQDFSDPKVWEKRRIALAHEVRETMRAQDSVTCRSCHDRDAVRPTSQRGQAAHALMREGRMTCIDCHFNLVHAPVPPSMSFIRGSGISGAAKK